MATQYKYGIDFGTSNCSVSIMETDVNAEGRYYPKCFVLSASEKFSQLMASEIALNRYGDVVACGVDAQEYFVKRLADYHLDNIKWSLQKEVVTFNETPLYFHDRPFSGVDAAATLLLEIKKQIDNGEPHPKTAGIVFGVPVGFEDMNKVKLIEAAIRAGLIENTPRGKLSVEFVSEPLAVAVNYGVKLESDQKVLIFDYGGGTLDVAILDMASLMNRMEVKEHEVLAKTVEETIGGKRLTWQFFYNSFLPRYGFERLKSELGLMSSLYDEERLENELKSKEEGIALLRALDNCKCHLSTKPVAAVRVMEGRLSIPSMEFTQEHFAISIRQEVDVAKSAVERALSEAFEKNGTTVDQIDMILMAGGSSMIPAFREMLVKLFGSTEKVKISGDPLTCIAHGLARVGFSKEGYKSQTINDIVDSDYGIWDAGRNAISVIIPKGMHIKDTIFNRETKSGIGKTYRVLDRHVTFMKLDVHQNGSYLNTLEIPLEKDSTQNQFKVFFEVDKQKGYLKVHVYDMNKQVFLDMMFGQNEIRIDWAN